MEAHRARCKQVARSTRATNTITHTANGSQQYGVRCHHLLVGCVGEGIITRIERRASDKRVLELYLETLRMEKQRAVVSAQFMQNNF